MLSNYIQVKDNPSWDGRNGPIIVAKIGLGVLVLMGILAIIGSVS
jgi:hypothetical protein